MLKNYRLIALVFVFAASGFGAYAQTTETNSYKDVLLDGKPAKLNLVTGEITFTNGEIATSRVARKIKDSVLDTRTEIKTNLLKDMVVSTETPQQDVASVATNPAIDDIKDSSEAKNTKLAEQTETKMDSRSNGIVTDLSSNNTLVSNQYDEETKVNTSNFHLVKKGETLYELSKRYHTSLGQLKIANNLETTLIKEGETLRVRNFESLGTESNGVWIVSRGDTLYNIAKRNNTTVNNLKNLNDLSGNLIKIGQKLQVNENSTLSKK